MHMGSRTIRIAAALAIGVALAIAAAISSDTIRVVDPKDGTLLAPTPEDALTLVTCYPFGYGARSPLRYVVRAEPLGPSRAVKGPLPLARSRQYLRIK